MSKNDFEDQLFGDMDLEDEGEEQARPYSSKPLDIKGIKDSHAEEIKRTLSRTQEMNLPSLSSSPRLEVSNIPAAPFWRRREIVLGTSFVVLVVVGAVALSSLGLFGTGNKSTNPKAQLRKRPAPMPSRHAVLLKTYPSGATVFVNGKKTKKLTPARIFLSTKNKTVVVLAKKGFEPIRRRLFGKLLFKSNKSVLRWELAKEKLKKKVLRDAASVLPFGYLSLTCDPPEASVLIGSETKSSCPINKMPIQVGDTSMEVKAEGYQPVQKSFKVSLNKITVLKIKLRKKKPKPKGSVEVTLVSKPGSVVYWYKGRKRVRLGTTPVTHTFPQGKQKLYLRNRRGLSMYYRLTVKGDKPFRRRIRFRKGVIKFFVKPWADVYINGKKYGQTPIKPVRLFQGRYRVELRLRKLRYRKRIYVNARRTYNFRHTFRRPRR